MQQMSYTLDEILDLERPAYHEAGDKLIDFVYDGINFWCQEQERRGPSARANACPRRDGGTC